jgi:hypothetical protein
MSDLDNQLIARYSLTKYAIMFMVRGILEKDETGKQLIQNPSNFITPKDKIPILKNVLSIVIEDIIIDLNAELNDLGEDFDYKSNLRSEVWVKELNRNISTNYQKQVNRNRIPSFKEEWEKSVVNQD